MKFSVELAIGIELVIGVELARAKAEPWPFRGASTARFS
jgi:hypothetical protein